MASKYNFSDVNGGESGSSAVMSPSKTRNGCFLGISTGFVLVLLAMVVAVGVGIIVHFAGGGAGQAVCHCEWQSQQPPSSDAIRDQCRQMAQEGDAVICNACALGSETSPMTDLSTTTSPMTSTQAPPVNYRLPGDVTPLHYQLELQPEIYSGDPATFTFSGSVTVRMRVEADTSQIVMHARGLNVHSDTKRLESVGIGFPPLIVGMSSVEETDFLILALSANIIGGREYLLTLTFDANLTDAGVGLYWSSYQDAGDTVYLATTKFEAPYARRVFPCFDEPRMKATFDVTLVRRNDTSRDYQSFSNEDVMSQEYRGNGYVADVFRRSPRMSTYLLAFIVCDYQYQQHIFPLSRLKYRTLARPNAIQHATRAQVEGVKMFQWLEDTFDPPYSLSKLDNIAIPDFLSGAMENWGLITYRETILYEEGVSTADDLSWTVEVIAHELVHMWFGNIVSPKWWSWLWLNEAFASFFDFMLVGKMYPTWRTEEQFLVVSMHGTLATDHLLTSHPMTAQVESPSEIQAIFDGVTYTKGAAVVRMMYYMLGEEAFYRGLNLYLDRRQYDVAEHQDLWDALTDQMTLEGRHINVTEIMDPWVTQMNYPVVHVTRSSDHTITVTQQRFLSASAGRDNGTAPYGYKWNIPVTYTSSVSPNFDQNFTYEATPWLRTTGDLVIRDTTALPSNGDANSWVIVNVQQLGYFRVNYDVTNWEALIRQLNSNHSVIHPINRAQIVNDAWSLAKEGQLNMSIALRTLDFLKNDTDYVPWRALARELGYVDSMLAFRDIYGSFKAMMRGMVETQYNLNGFDMPASLIPVQIFERARFVGYACEYGLTSCVNAAVDKFTEWSQNISARVHPNLQHTVYCTAIREGGEEEWNIVLERYRQTDSSSEQARMLTSLACTREPWLLNRLLAMALDPAEVRAQDSGTLISAVSSNHVGRDVTWAFLRSNFRSLVTKMTSSRLSRVIATVTSTFNTEAQLKELEDYIASNDVKEAASAFSTAVEATKSNIKWMADNYAHVQAWLASAA